MSTSSKVKGLFIVAVLLFFSFQLGRGYAQYQDWSSRHEYAYTVTSSDDSLWEIAVMHKPTYYDTRDYINWVMSRNDMNTSIIHYGDTIILK